jgi:hypothetical protein
MPLRLPHSKNADKEVQSDLTKLRLSITHAALSQSACLDKERKSTKAPAEPHRVPPGRVRLIAKLARELHPEDFDVDCTVDPNPLQEGNLTAHCSSPMRLARPRSEPLQLEVKHRAGGTLRV